MPIRPATVLRGVIKPAARAPVAGGILRRTVQLIEDQVVLGGVGLGLSSFYFAIRHSATDQ